MNGKRLCTLMLQNYTRMILQVLPHSRQINDGLNIMLFQVIGRTNSGQHQCLRRIDRTTTQDNFLFSLYPDSIALIKKGNGCRTVTR